MAFSRADSSGTRIPATGKTTLFPQCTFSIAESLTPQVVPLLTLPQMEAEQREGRVQDGTWRTPIEGPTRRVPHAAHRLAFLRARADPSISINSDLRSAPSVFHVEYVYGLWDAKISLRLASLGMKARPT